MSYPGGKGASGVVQNIINQIPKHFLYVEPFAGNASVFRAFNTRPKMSLLIEKNWEQVRALSGQFDNCFLEHGCGIEWMQMFARFSMLQNMTNAFVYVDPPYLLETRTRKHIYGEFELSDACHAAILEIIKHLKCRVAISGYASAMYDNALSHWRRIEFPAMTRGGVRTEVLWMNYPEPTELHDYSYVGSDRTERQSFKRLCDRWQSKLATLPGVQQRALLAALESSVGRAS